MSLAQLRAAAPTRVSSIDALRGIAMLCMALDHLMIVTGGPFALRMTVGRMALPLFFVIAGAMLTKRPRPLRLVEVGAWGLVLPVLIPWIDSPNVLLWYAVLAYPVYVLATGPSWALPLGSAFVLAWIANAGSGFVGTGYDPAPLLGFMLLGAMCGPHIFRNWLRNWRAPRWLVVIGSRPLEFYIVHLGVLQVVWLVLR